MARRPSWWAASGSIAVLLAADAVAGTAVPIARADPQANAAQTPAKGRPGVAALQVALRARGLYAATVDGIRGPLTRQGVRRFQARRGLVVDGIAGPRTRAALGWRGRPGLGARAIGSGARGWDVAALQFLLATRGFPSGEFDGRLGPRGAGRAAALPGLGRARGRRRRRPGHARGRARPAAALRPALPRAARRHARPTASGHAARSMHTGLDYPAARRAPAWRPPGAAA